jgi:putative flippase GtrA
MLKKIFVDPTNHPLLQLFRYGLVVGIAGPIDFGGYVILQMHMYSVLAATISFTVSLIVNYLLSVAWVFTAKTGKQRRVDAIIFGIIGLVGLGITDLIIWILTDVKHVNAIIAKLIAFMIVFFWSFGARRWLFTRKPKEPVIIA